MKRTTEGLRSVLFDELQKYLDGKVSDGHVKSITSMTNAILQTVAKDLEAAKLAHEMSKGADQPKAIADLRLNLMLDHVDSKE